MVQRTIAHYELLTELGHGAMAAVYRARDTRLGREVAMKLLRREYLTDLGFRSRFEQEATLVAALSHPAIIPIYEFGQHEGQLFLVMPYMANGSLAARLAGGPLPPEEVAAILARIGAALDYAHEQGIVHRDLKPSNILFDEDGQAFLGDFGIALQPEGGGSETMLLGGTPAYMSPEQGRREAGAGESSDRYALAVTAFQMLTGRLPFSGDSPVAVLLQHLHRPPPSLRDFDPELPPALDAVMQHALAKDAAARYPSASALAAAVAAALAHPEQLPPPPLARAATADPAPPRASEPRPAPRLPATVVSPPAAEPPASIAAPAFGEAPGWYGWVVARPLRALALVALLAVLLAAVAVAVVNEEGAVAGAPESAATADGDAAAAAPSGATGEAAEEQAAEEEPAAGQLAPEQPAEEAAPPPAGPPAVLILYDEARFTVVNAGPAPVAISALSFHRAPAETLGAAAFGGGEWGGVAGNVVHALPPGHCFQLVNLGAPGPPGPAQPEGCADLRGWIGTRQLHRLPFLSGGAASFEVVRNGETIASCAIAGGSCRAEWEE